MPSPSTSSPPRRVRQVDSLGLVGDGREEAIHVALGEVEARLPSRVAPEQPVGELLLAPLQGQLPVAQLQSIQTLVSNSQPSVICAYGDENQIELSSNSKTLGLDLKALGRRMTEEKKRSSSSTKLWSAQAAHPDLRRHPVSMNWAAAAPQSTSPVAAV